MSLMMHRVLKAVDRVLDSLYIRHLRLRHMDRSPRSRLTESPTLLPPTPSLRIILFVSSEIEANEEQQVRAQYSHARERRKFLPGTLPKRREAREVGGREVGVRGEIDESEIDNELNDL